jgi:hypothetical protein
MISFDHHIGGYASLTKPLILPACQSLVRRAVCIFIPHDEDPMHNPDLILFNGVYFIEIGAVVFVFYKSCPCKFNSKLNKYIWLVFFGRIMGGIVIQNIL